MGLDTTNQQIKGYVLTLHIHAHNCEEKQGHVIGSKDLNIIIGSKDLYIIYLSY
jgi:hypothetical protein